MAIIISIFYSNVADTATIFKDVFSNKYLQYRYLQ